jgi:AcrR family transcriptional regulator
MTSTPTAGSESPPQAPADGPPGGGRERRRHQPPEARRAQILAAALSCFGEKGYHASTMDDLVRASGLSKGSLYWHFSSKEDVFLALFDAFSEELYGEWDRIAESDDDKLEVLRRECESSAQRFANKREFLMTWVEFLAHPAARERMRDAYAIAREKLVSIVEAGRANGSLRPGPPAEGVASTLVAALEGLLLQWLVDPEFDLEGHVRVSWTLLAEGVRP